LAGPFSYAIPLRNSDGAHQDDDADYDSGDYGRNAHEQGNEESPMPASCGAPLTAGSTGDRGTRRSRCHLIALRLLAHYDRLLAARRYNRDKFLLITLGSVAV
jgi:hypothetical protein